MKQKLADWLRLVRLSARLVAGQGFWIAPLLPLLWHGFQAFSLLVGMAEEDFGAASAQGTLIGLPLTVLAIGLGVRIIAGELERRTMEIAYTVPGGAHRIWIAKLAAAILILIVAEALLEIATFAFFTSFPLVALYGALQPAVVYLVLSMGFAALFKSECALRYATLAGVTGAMGSAAVLTLNGFLTGFGEHQQRVSPFWNPLSLGDTSDAIAASHTVQNRIGFLLVIAALTAFARAERREKLLGG